MKRTLVGFTTEDVFYRQRMKRFGSLFEDIISVDNLMLADSVARKGKTNNIEIIKHDLNREENILKLHDSLKNKTYKTSEYKVFTIYEPKERLIYKLPYYPDRIVHHAIMNVLEPIFVSTFTKDTYSCIKKRGIHAAANSLKIALKDKENTKYCLKTDIKKFYPNIDHEILKQLLRKKIKDKDLLWLLDEIIDSTDGVPIGNYLSQYFANLYLTYFDHWIKEEKKVKYYFRYADDMIFLSNSKEFLHKLLFDLKNYLKDKLKLNLKNNYQIFPVNIRGIDFVGYVFRHDYVLLRKSIKQRFIKMVLKNKNIKSLAAYNGWLIHCDSKNLMKKYLYSQMPR
jgi:retron-type reverse transcriptase